MHAVTVREQGAGLSIFGAIYCNTPTTHDSGLQRLGVQYSYMEFHKLLSTADMSFRSLSRSAKFQEGFCFSLLIPKCILKC